jgi:hypothetical protein
MASIESALCERLAQAFRVVVPPELQAPVDSLPPHVRQVLLGELFRMALQAWQARPLLPRHAPLTLQLTLAGCRVGLELDASCARLSLRSLERRVLQA